MVRVNVCYFDWHILNLLFFDWKYWTFLSENVNTEIFYKTSHSSRLEWGWGPVWKGDKFCLSVERRMFIQKTHFDQSTSTWLWIQNTAFKPNSSDYQMVQFLKQLLETLLYFHQASAAERIWEQRQVGKIHYWVMNRPVRLRTAWSLAPNLFSLIASWASMHGWTYAQA